MRAERERGTEPHARGCDCASLDWRVFLTAHLNRASATPHPAKPALKGLTTSVRLFCCSLRPSLRSFECRKGSLSGADGQQVRTTKTEENERGGRKPTPVMYHGGKFDLKPNYYYPSLSIFSWNKLYLR